MEWWNGGMMEPWNDGILGTFVLHLIESLQKKQKDQNWEDNFHSN